ncbi:MAG: DUF502 domain-containing protein [Elusimicrobiota bacterium]
MSIARRLQRYLITGFLIVAPVGITVFLLASFVAMLDYFATPMSLALLGRHVRGLGLLLLGVMVLAAGVLGSNIKGKHVLGVLERLLLQIPVFSWLYGTIKQLTEVLSPDGTAQFKSVVLVEYPRPGVYSIGFATNQVQALRPDGTREDLTCVYVPTNHIYIGDVILVPEGKVMETRLTLQEGLQTLLSAGATTPKRLETTLKPLSTPSPQERPRTPEE